MIIYVKDLEEILKYDVIFEKEKLENIKYEIINKCSFIKHMDYQDTKVPKILNSDDVLKIRNLKQIKVGVQEYNDFYSQSEDLYRFIYDEYNYPYLVCIINKILNENDFGIKELLGKIGNSENYFKKISSLSKSIDRINNINTRNKIKKLKELENLLKLKELNKNQEDVKKYYNKVNNLLTYKLIDKLRISEINKIIDFLNKDFNFNYLEKKNIKLKMLIK